MIATDRLVLRRFEERDRAVYVAHAADPAVMRFLLALPNAGDVDEQIARQDGYFAQHGFGFWIVEERARGVMIGVCGLKPGREDTPLEGAVEIGWRLGRESWGRGFAREAAEAALDWAFATLPERRIGAITVPDNAASWGLMERIGMVRDPAGDFDHPAVAPDSPFRRHITYWKYRP